MWDPSDLQALSHGESTADYFVKISHSTNILEERTNIDHLLVLFYRVLRY
jgi:hypothetical protein